MWGLLSWNCIYSTFFAWGISLCMESDFMKSGRGLFSAKLTNSGNRILKICTLFESGSHLEIYNSHNWYNIYYDKNSFIPLNEKAC